MVFRDQRLSCENCGRTFFFTVTEQRKIAERQGIEQVETPTLCPDCRGTQPAQSAAPVQRPERAPAREQAAPPVKEQGPSIAETFPHQEGGIELKLIGTVKWFSRAKGYGFITKADGEDLFFHRAELAAGSQGWPEDGQRVEFQIRQTQKGPEAFNVSLLPTE
jgi:CspA family cold shock protein